VRLAQKSNKKTSCACEILHFGVTDWTSKAGMGSRARRLEHKISRLSAEIIERLKDALAFALDIERASE
jgi:hypothetical protein